MILKLKCKNCFAKVSADDELIGKEVRCPGCNAKFTLPKPQFGFGKTLGGYVIEQWLGSGAMGEVYLARQLSMNRLVALKVIKDDMTTDREVIERFVHESQILASLNHPYIVSAFDAGTIENCYYMAMSYVDGETLEEKLKRQGRLDETEVLDIALKVSDALNYAWTELKLLHRDIKPANIMVDKSGEVKIMDMGIAKNANEDGGLTQAGLVVGTPFYMSPEQAQASKEIDYRSDLYALGASMYHVLAGVLPFQGPNVMSILAKKVTHPVIPPNQINANLTKETSDLIIKLLNFRADNRLSSFDEFNQMLKKAKIAASKKSAVAGKDHKTVHITVPEKVALHAKNKSHHKLTQRLKNKGSSQILIVAGLVLAVLGLAITLWILSKNETTGENPSTKENETTETKNNSEVTASNNVDKFVKDSTLFMWKARKENTSPGENLFGKERKVTIGEYGEIKLSTDTIKFDKEHYKAISKIKNQNKFTIVLNLLSDKMFSRGCILAFGDSINSSYFTIAQDNNEYVLLSRNHKGIVERNTIAKTALTRKVIMITYEENVLKFYDNGELILTKDNVLLKTSIWRIDGVNLGGFRDGERQSWQGNVYFIGVYKDVLPPSMAKDFSDKVRNVAQDGGF